MSELKILDAADGRVLKQCTDLACMAGELRGLGVRYERWRAERPLTRAADQDEVLQAYAAPVAALNAEYGFRSVDVVSLTPDHPERAAMRGKFLAEHTHADFEVRFFVDGHGLFYVNAGARIYSILCERGDLISVPADTRHWFDMGPEPDFKCIRFFTTPDGWVGNFTGSDLADRFPRLGD